MGIISDAFAFVKCFLWAERDFALCAGNWLTCKHCSYIISYKIYRNNQITKGAKNMGEMHEKLGKLKIDLAAMKVLIQDVRNQESEKPTSES